MRACRYHAPVMSIPAPSAAPERGLVFLLAAIMAFGPLTIDMYLPAMPTLRVDLLASTAQVQLTLSAYLIGLACGQLVYGPVTDRFGRKRPLCFGIALFTVASIGCALADSIESLIAMRVLQALGGAAGMVVVRAVVRDLFDLHASARVYSTLILVMGVAPILAPAIGGQILLWLDWRWIFGALALLGGSCLVAVVLRLPETLTGAVMAANRARPLASVLSDYAQVLGTRRFITHALTGGSALAAVFAYISGSPFVLIELLGVSPEWFGLWFGINATAFIVGSQVNARLLRSFGPRTILPWTVASFLAASLFLLAVVVTPLFSLGAFLVAMCLVLLSVGCTLANTTALALQPFVRQAGAASAMLGTLQLGSGALAGLMVGISYDGSAAPLALVVAGCAVLGALALRAGMMERADPIKDQA